LTGWANHVVTSNTTYTLDTATSLTMVLAETDSVSSHIIYYWQGLDLLAQSDGTTIVSNGGKSTENTGIKSPLTNTSDVPSGVGILRRCRCSVRRTIS
jgi:hypothetical protein